MITLERVKEMIDAADRDAAAGQYPVGIKLVLDSDERQEPRLYCSLSYRYGKFNMTNLQAGVADLSELSEPTKPDTFYDKFIMSISNPWREDTLREFADSYREQLKKITDTDVERKKAEIKRRQEFAKEIGGLICRE